jgi:hypothetical protein
MYAHHTPARPSNRRPWSDPMPLWTVADASGRILARSITLAQLEARFENGLLPGAEFAANQDQGAWRRIREVISPSGAHRMPCLWYVTRRGANVVGPVETDLLQRGILAGRVPSDSVVCRAGEVRWEPLDDVPEFADHVADTLFDSELTQATELAAWRGR